MGAEESHMYDNQSYGGYRTIQGKEGKQRGKQQNSMLIPQVMLLAGFTAEGEPILVSNPIHNSTLNLLQTSSNTQRPTMPPLLPQQSLAMSSFSSVGFFPQMTNNPTLPLQQASADPLLTITSATPVIAVARPVLGPDGNIHTAIVKPTSVSDIGAQIISNGILRNGGGTYQVIREPDGRTARHVFPTNDPLATINASTSTNSDPNHSQYNTTTKYRTRTSNLNTSLNGSGYYQPKLSESSISASHPDLTYSSISSSSSTSLASPVPSHLATVSPPPTKSSPTSSYTTSSSPVHPAVQSTANFLKVNSTLDTSYCPSPSDLPEAQVVGTIVIQKPSKSAVTNSGNPSKSEADSDASSHIPPPEYSSVVSSTSSATTRQIQNHPNSSDSTSASTTIKSSSTAEHKPSKALKSLYSQGGDKGLIETYNPYDDL